MSLSDTKRVAYPPAAANDDPKAHQRCYAWWALTIGEAVILILLVTLYATH